MLGTTISYGAISLPECYAMPSTATERHDVPSRRVVLSQSMRTATLHHSPAPQTEVNSHLPPT
eukprot:3385351-Rhodomonas_salina.1